jgi:uncharacterized protein YigE (DUF2233 family)
MTCRPMSRTAMPSIAIVLYLSTTLALAGSVSRQQVAIKVPGGLAVDAHVFTVVAAEARIRVLTSRDLKERSLSSHGVSVREAAETSLVSKVISMQALLFNGGYSESPTDRPAGLLVSDGAVVSLANFAIRRADPSSNCPLRHQDRPRLPGVLCVARDGAVSIDDLAAAKPTECREAVQAGPLLVEKAGETAVCLEESAERTFRTAVCLRQRQMLVVVTQAPISLYGLATWLAAPAGPDGLGCDRALNLSGDTSSGAVYFPGGIPSLTKPLRVGPGTFPLPSLILVQSRRLP